MKSKVLGFWAALCFVGASAIHGYTFVETAVGLPATLPTSTSIADYDGDGRMDLLCFDLGTTNYVPSLFHNSTNGFQKVSVGLRTTTYGVTSSFWADDNGDGLLDLMIASEDDLRALVSLIYTQTADHTFTLARTIPGTAIGWVDLDNDGRLDILTSTGVLWKEADGSYTSSSFLTNPGVVDWADIDNDGDLDLITQSGRIFRNDRARHFVDTGITFGSFVALGDMDGDNRIDIICNKPNSVFTGGSFGGPTQATYNDTPLIIYNRGNLNFETNSVFTGSPYYHAAAAGDFNADGRSDLFTISPPLGFGFAPLIFTNTGNGFQSATNITFSPAASEDDSFILADIDGDGDLDALGINGQTRRRFFRNVSEAKKFVTAPKNLTTSVRGTVAMFSWEGDPNNGSTSFNLRVGTASGLNDVVASMSQPSGRRQLPRRGDIQGTRWQIRDLKPGVYYWTVQSIDSAQQGSPFSEEQMFTVTGAASAPLPQISEIPDAFTDEDIPVEVGFTIGPESAVSDLKVTVESSDPNLTPATSFQLRSSGANQTLIILPRTNVNGTASITVRVTDGLGQVATNSFVLTVFPVNDPPTITPIPNQIVYNNSGTINIPISFGDVESGLRNGPRLTVTAVSLDQNILPTANVSIGIPSKIPSSSQLGVNIVVPTNKVGSVTIQVTVNDSQLQTSASFVLTILPALFQDIGQSLGATINGDISWADFNNDGRLDLFVSAIGATPPLPLLFLNTGTNRFQPSSFQFTEAHRGRAAIIDFNGDNYLDLVTVSDSGVRVHLNDKGTNFITISATPVAFTQSANLNFGDFDNDGDLDLIVSGVNPTNGVSGSTLFVNQSGALIATKATFPSGVPNWTIADIDGDGWADALFNAYDPVTSITRGGIMRKGTNSLLQLESGSSAWVPGAWSSVVDFNGDGLPDLLLPSAYSLLVYTNTGGRFTTNTIPLGSIITAVNAVGDFDGDGLLDLIASTGTSISNSLKLVRNAGAFDLEILDNSLAFARGIVIPGDFNNDGALDFALYRTLPPTGLRVFTNTSHALNPPPSAPANLRAEIHGNGAILSWVAPADFNQYSGFTYNVRVGSRPGASDIVSASALPSGKRLLVAAGNAGGRKFMILTNLPSETLYWTVQAIDNSYAGGPFASEQRVNVPLPGNQPPSVTISPDHYVGAEDASGSFEITLSDDHTAPDDLKLRAYALDARMIPYASISIAGFGNNRTLRFKPAQDLFGETEIMFVATDAVGGSTTNKIPITVTNVNDYPIISLVSPSYPFYSNGPGDPVSAQFRFSDVDDDPESLELTVEIADTTPVPVSILSLSRTLTNGIATLGTSSSIPALVPVTLTVTDPHGLSSSVSFAVNFTNRVFTAATNRFPGVRSGSMAWGDYDDDRDLDLILHGDGMVNSVLYNNQGGGIFQIGDASLPALSGGIWVDIDRDGDLDFLYSGAVVLTNDSGVLRQVPGFFSSDAAMFADLDNDGDLDAVREFYLSGIPHSQLYENEAGAFTRIPDPFGTTGYIPLFLEDFNQDGFIDMFTLRSSDTPVPVTFLQSSNTFIQTTNLWPADLKVWADFDNDGHPEALVDWPYYNSNLDGITGLTLIKNVGTPNVTRIPVSASHAWNVAVADYDNDGFLDIFANVSGPNYADVVKLFHNNGDNTFTEVQHPFPDATSVTFSFADVNNDGAIDVMITGQPPNNQYFSTLYLNHQTTTNQPPEAPTNLRAFNTADGLMIEWDEAHDPNQTGGLTYNLAVGTAPGQWNILTPMSGHDGWRKIVDKGNAGWLRRKLVRGLELGRTYYFTVQAIDNSFAGSPFAPEQTITIQAPPRIEQSMLANNELTFTVTSASATTYVIECSTDLQSWTEMKRVYSTSTANFHFPNNGESMRFVRVRGL